MRILVSTFILHFLLTLTACSGQETANSYTPIFSNSAESSNRKILRLAIVPLYTPEKIDKMFSPLEELIRKSLPEYQVILETSRDYASFDEKIRKNEIHFALANPYQTVQSLKHNYEVIGKMDNDESFKGILIVAKNSGIKNIEQMRGKKISFPAPTALAASMMPQHYLFHKGLSPKKDFQINYVGSQESSILAVLYGQADVAGSWPMAWENLKTQNPEVEKKLEIIAETDNLPSNALIVSRSLPTEVKNKIQKVFISLQDFKEGRDVLAAMNLSMFKAAKDSDYHRVTQFIKEFNAEIGMVGEE